MGIRNPVAIAEYNQLVDEILPYSHDFSPYTLEHQTSVFSCETVDADSGLTLAGSLTADVWNGTITAANPGHYQFRLRGTMADGTIKVELFQVNIREPRSGLIW